MIPHRVYRQLTRNPVLGKTQIALKSYSGHDIPTVGKCSIRCTLDSSTKLLIFYVTETNSRTIIGLESCGQLGLVTILSEIQQKMEMESVEDKIKRIQGGKGEDLIDAVLKLYPGVFTE